MAQFPGLVIWTDAWVADTHHMQTEARGLYMDMLILAWRTPGCRLPNDRAWLLEHLKPSASAADHLEPIIGSCWTSDGNWLTQKRLSKEFLKAFGRSKRLGDLHKRRKNKRSDANGSRSSDTDHRSPHGNLNYTKEDKPSHTVAAEEPNHASPPPLQTPSSLASALPQGALARPAPSELVNPKKPWKRYTDEELRQIYADQPK